MATKNQVSVRQQPRGTSPFWSIYVDGNREGGRRCTESHESVFSLIPLVRVRPDGVVPKGKPKNDANRRALGDISNVVTADVRAPISRTITRGFGTQLLANAQAAAAVTETKKSVAVGNEGKPKAAAKGKSQIVIQNSPDTNKPKNERSESKRNRRKNIHTLSSVLSARSKAACGIVGTSKESIPDIDAADVGDQLAVVDYVGDLYKFYKISENSTRLHDYMGSQADINEKTRSILLDWLIKVHHSFELRPETLYLTSYIIDRYLSMEQVLSREVQLVGMSSMLIAAKYEEIWAPPVEEFVSISDHAYSQENMLAMERSILDKLEWSLTVPTPYVFLVRFIKAAMCDEEMEHMVFFFAELALLQYSMIMFRPSMVAASAVFAARCTLRKRPLWTETLKRHAGFSGRELLDPAQILVKSHSDAPECDLKAVYKKYSSPEFGEVALRPPAVKMLEVLKAASA